MNSTENYSNLTTSTEYDYYEGYDFITAYTSAILNIIIIPVQLVVAKIIWSHNELWSNASYCLLFRLIMVEFVQSLSTVISGIFPLAPEFWYMDFPRKSCAVALSAGFLMLFPLMSELSIFRILIIMKKAQPNNLPLLLLVFEIFCFLLTAALGIGIYHNESIHFYYGDWVFKHDIFSTILNTAELYFCYPMLILTYCSYLFLIGLIYGIRKGSRTPAKEECILFGVSTFTTIYFCCLIGYFQFFGCRQLSGYGYMGPESPVGSFFFQVWIQFISGTNYYWTALILLLFNKVLVGDASLQKDTWYRTGGAVENEQTSTNSIGISFYEANSEEPFMRMNYEQFPNGTGKYYFLPMDGDERSSDVVKNVTLTDNKIFIGFMMTAGAIYVAPLDSTAHPYKMMAYMTYETFTSKYDHLETWHSDGVEIIQPEALCFLAEKPNV